MAHFYFHLLNDVGLMRDNEGEELPDLPAAQAHARKVAAEIIAEELTQCRDTVKLCLMIEDHQGKRLADVKAVTSIAIEHPADTAVPLSDS